MGVKEYPIMRKVIQHFSPEVDSLIVICESEFDAVHLSTLLDVEIDRGFYWKENRKHGYLSERWGDINFAVASRWKGDFVSSEDVLKFFIKPIIKGRIEL